MGLKLRDPQGGTEAQRGMATNTNTRVDHNRCVNFHGSSAGSFFSAPVREIQIKITENLSYSCKNGQNQKHGG